MSLIKNDGGTAYRSSRRIHHPARQLCRTLLRVQHSDSGCQKGDERGNQQRTFHDSYDTSSPSLAITGNYTHHPALSRSLVQWGCYASYRKPRLNAVQGQSAEERWDSVFRPKLSLIRKPRTSGHPKFHSLVQKRRSRADGRRRQLKDCAIVISPAE